MMIAVPRSPPSRTSARIRPPTGSDRHQQVLPLAEQPLLAGQQVGAPEHQRQLRQLGGLDPERAAEVEPVLVAVDLGAGDDDQHQQRERRRPARGRRTIRQASTGSRDAHHISGSPMTTHIACLLTIAIDEPMNANATTLDAENTMTRPSTSSRVLAPSSR